MATVMIIVPIISKSKICNTRIFIQFIFIDFCGKIWRPHIPPILLFSKKNHQILQPLCRIIPDYR